MLNIFRPICNYKDKMCSGQDRIKGSHCLKNKCYGETMELGSQKNISGDVVVLNDPDKSILKWNRSNADLSNYYKECYITRIAGNYGISPFSSQLRILV